MGVLKGPRSGVQSYRRRLNLAMGGGPQTYIDKVLGYGPIAYWPLNETSGTTAVCQVNPAQNGTYARNVTVMGTGAGIGDGNTAPEFDGTNDVIDIFSAALNAAFSGAEGTMFAWARVSGAGVWADGQVRGNIQCRVDANNEAFLSKRNVVDALQYIYRAGGNAEFSFPVLAPAPTAFFTLAHTWSVVANTWVSYYNGAVDNTRVGLGVWAGALDNTLTVIGALSTAPVNPWDGRLAHCMIFDSALALPQIADLSTV